MNNLLTINITSVDECDIESIRTIEKRCGLSKWTADGHRQEINRRNSIYFAARSGEAIIGFLTARINHVAKAEAQTEAETEAEAELDLLNFGVLDNYRRCGVGSRLWERFLKYAAANSVESIWLEVRASNTVAIEFYQKKGFETVQVRKNFYTSPPENALLMKAVCLTRTPKSAA